MRSPMLTDGALREVRESAVSDMNALQDYEVRDLIGTFLAAQDREALAEVLARIADPGAFTGDGYHPDAMPPAREAAMDRAREQIRALLDGSRPNHPIGVAMETIPAGAMIEVDPATGQIRRAR